MMLALTGCATSTPRLGSSGDLLPSSQSQEVYHLAQLDQVEVTLADGSKHNGKIDSEGVLHIDPDVNILALGSPTTEIEAKLKGVYHHVTQIQWKEFRDNSVSVL